MMKSGFEYSAADGEDGPGDPGSSYELQEEGVPILQEIGWLLEGRGPQFLSRDWLLEGADSLDELREGSA